MALRTHLAMGVPLSRSTRAVGRPSDAAVGSVNPFFGAAEAAPLRNNPLTAAAVRAAFYSRFLCANFGATGRPPLRGLKLATPMLDEVRLRRVLEAGRSLLRRVGGASRGQHDRRKGLEQAVRGLEASTAIARAVGAETDLTRILELIVERASGLIDARGVLILLREGDELVVAALAGRLEGALLHERVPVEGSISGHVMQTRRSERLHDMPEQQGFSMADQIAARSGLFVPLVFRGRELGVLNVFDRAGGEEEFTAEDELLLEGFAASAATAVATAQTVASEGLRRSIEASEREREHWAHELHDETLQELAGLKVLLSGARRSNDLVVLQRTLDTALERIDTEITGLRRLITDLRPAALDAFGVKPAVEGLAERIAATSGLEIELDVRLACEPRRLAPTLESTLYRLVQEALGNVVKHADAGSVVVSIVEREDRVEVTVRDDGDGFDPAAATDGFGLLGMRERVLLVDGGLEVTSAPGAGTTVRASLPVARA